MDSNKKKIGNKISSYVVVALKSAKLVKFVQAIKLLKFAKPFVMVFSMLISILAYSAIWSPAFAVGFVLLLFFHEMGHVIAINKEGFKTNAPVFIPFLGAMIFSPKNMDRRQEAVIGIGGVVLGGIVSFILLAINFFYPSKYLIAFAYVGFALNLFQMIPLSPMDGGRVIQAVGRNFQFVGIIALMAVSIMIHQPSILLIWIIVFLDFRFLSFKQRLFGASFVELALIVFTIFKIGIPDSFTFTVCVVDSILGLIYVGMIMLAWRADRDATESSMNQPERPSLDIKQRFFWLGAFIFATASLFLAMIYVAPMLKDLKF